MIRKLYFLFFLIFLLIHLSHGQENPCHLKVSGSIIDVESKEGLPGAAVLVKELNTGVTSDIHGEFYIQNICPGKYFLEIRYLGYKTIVKEVIMDHNTEMVFELEAEVIALEDVIIEGHREEILNAQSVATLKSADLQRISGQTLGATLGTISGVSMLQTGSTISKPVIHGMHSNRVLLLLNGIRHEGQQWGLEHAPEIDPFIASEMSVIKGAAAVQHGPDAIGGVVIIDPPELNGSEPIGGQLHMVGESNGRSGTVSGTIQGGIGSWKGFGWRVQGTLKKAGNLKAPDYYLSNTGVEEANLSTAIGYKSNKWGTELFYSSFNSTLGILSASHTNNLTDLENALERGEPFDAETAEFSYEIDRPFQEVSHHFLTSKSFYKIRKDLQLHLAYGYQQNNRGEYDRVRQSIAGSGRPQLDFSLTTHNLDVHLDHRLSGDLTGSIGVNGQRQSNIFEGRQLIPNFRSYNGGVYLIEHLIKPRYELELGVRYDYKFLETFRNESGEIIRDEFTFNNFSSVIGGIYQVNKDLKVRLNLSTAWRPPNINELFSDGVHQGVASYELGNPELVSEKAYNTNLSLNLSKDWLQLEATAYYHHIQDYIFLEPQFPETVLTIRGAFPLFEYKQVNARFVGLDLDALVKINSSLNWRVKGAMVRARDLTNNNDLIWIPTDRLENEFVYTWNKDRLGQSPYVMIGTVSAREQTNFPSETDFADPPDGFTLINVGAGHGFLIGENELGVHFTADNILNTSYREYMNRFRYFADEPGFNFTIRLNYNF